MNLVDEIRMTALLPSLVPNLPSLALQGLSDNNSTIYRSTEGYSKTSPENTYRPEGTLNMP
jgi:hypothetical protein